LGAKTATMQNLGDRFVVFSLGGQNRNFVKVRGLKLQLSLKKIIKKKKIKRIQNYIVQQVNFIYYFYS